MPNPGFIRGTHHLTFCVGTGAGGLRLPRPSAGAAQRQEDRPVRRRDPDLPPVLRQRRGRREHAADRLPLSPGGWMGKRGTNQAKILLLSVPVGSIGYWSDRFKEHGVDHERIERVRHRAPPLPPPLRDRVRAGGDPGHDTREPYDRRVPAEHAIRGAYGTTTSVTRAGPDGLLHRPGHERRAARRRGREPPVPDRSGPTGSAGSLELVEEPQLHQGTWHFGEGIVHHQAFDVGTADEPGRWSRTTSSGSASPTSRRPRTAATSSPCTAAAPAGC